MNIGDEVIVLDDGKHRRIENGVISFIFDDNTIAIYHKLWGYGEQQPMHQLYKRDANGWSGVQNEYIDEQGKICTLVCEEWARLKFKDV